MPNTETIHSDNPLLLPITRESLPQFDKLQAEHFLPAIEQVLQQSESAIFELVEKTKDPDWETLFHPLETIFDRIEQVWSVISQINGVANNDEVRNAYAACLPLLTAFNTKMGQYKPLFELTKAFKSSNAFNQFSETQKKVIENSLRDFTLAGVDLHDAEQERYAEIKSRMAKLTTQYSNNVLDATQAFSKHIESEQVLKGLPELSLNAARELAKSKNLEGFVFTLDIPSYLPVMQYCENADLREQMYTAFSTRASELGPNAGEFDNSANMEEILGLRLELATLLGFANYAELSIEKKMATTTEDVLNFLHDLAEKSTDIAKKEYAELQNYAKEELAIEKLQAWDIAFASEKLRQERYAISQEELRVYFPIDKVIAGMFEVVRRLYGLRIEAEIASSVWDKEVRFFSVYDANNEIKAQFYLDPFARDGKRGGAWMAGCKSRRVIKAGELQIPVAFLVCNFTPPSENKPSLLTHNEVTTLFHEFGHGLHHMLTAIDESDVSGINGVAWDAVELPSQFMENWCWEEEALALFSSHYETGESLPKELLEKMLAAKNFQSAMQMVRQIEFALFDFLMHKDFGTNKWDGIAATLSSVRQQVAAYEVPGFNRFQNSFSHIFAGGYAAGYYSYKWAEVLSSDAYSLFEENGIFDSVTGRKFYDEVLSQGGSKEPAILFKRFRGRDANTDALLRHSGIVTS